MKKILLLLTTFLLLTSCQTKEEIEEKKKQEEIKILKEEINNREVPENTKKWILENETEKVLTILCISTSTKCNKLKENIGTINKSIKTYFFNVDELSEEELKTYKTKYNLEDYTGYLPYIIVSERNKLITTIKDKYKTEEIIEILKREKLIADL